MDHNDLRQESYYYSGYIVGDGVRKEEVSEGG